MVRKNKKGILRIIEAIIAIMLIAGVLLFLYVNNIENPKKAEEVYNFQTSVMEEIANDAVLRNAVLDSNITMINNFIQPRMPSSFNFTIKICNIDEICGPDVYRAQAYSSERIISSTLKEYSPKKLKIFMWLK